MGLDQHRPDLIYRSGQIKFFIYKVVATYFVLPGGAVNHKPDGRTVKYFGIISRKCIRPYLEALSKKEKGSSGYISW